MDKKALIAIGVIAVLGIGTYAIIVSKNKNKNSNTNNTGGIKTPPSSSPSPTNESLLCKYLKIGCGASGRIDL